MSFHLFHIKEVFSNANGTVQYIVFHGESNNQHLWAGHSMTMAAAGQPTKTFNFTTHLPSTATSGKEVLVATQGFADLGLVTPDYIIPDGFLFPGGGTLNYVGMDDITFSALPTNGYQARGENGTSIVTGSPGNFSGDSVVLDETSGIPGGIFYKGSAGANTRETGVGHDGLFGNGGADTLSGGAGDDAIVGGNGNDQLNGGEGDDTLRGGADNDRLDGGASDGEDRLFGDDGNDRLTGGDGSDNLNGGKGADKLTWDALDAKTDGGANSDTLVLGESLDLTTLLNSLLVNIEKIDMTGGATDSVLTLNKAEVLAIGSGNTLTVLGDDGETVSLLDIWTEGATAGGFTTWTRGTAILKIQDGVDVLTPPA